MSYPQLLRSLPGLIQTQPVLRESSLIGAMLFGSFSAFWTTLVFFLAVPPYHYGSEVAGLFSLVGVGGALAAPIIGRLADKKNPKLTVGLGIAITMASFLVFWLFGAHLIGLIIGVILLDLGVQSGHVSNQTRIYSLLPQARSRLNMVYMVCYFLGGGLGSSLGAYAWSVWHWAAVCAVGLLMMMIAFVVYFGGGKRQHPSSL
jgi:predicted MFS family arabinose efflux permease